MKSKSLPSIDFKRRYPASAELPPLPNPAAKLEMKNEIANDKRKPILSIVEDDGSVRKALVRAGTALGFACNPFGSAEAFLESAEPTDCLIADIGLPGIDGLKLLEKMCKCKPAIPVLLITAHANDLVESQARANGAAGFFYKPLDLDILFECIRKVLFDLN